MTNKDEYNYTPHFELPLYNDETQADLRQGYNDAIRKIDTALHQIQVALETYTDYKKY